MKERPILFNGEMVRAILEGRKTQTRRLVKLSEFSASDTPGYDFNFRGTRRGGKGHLWQDMTIQKIMNLCTLGQPGDRLWVRETWQAVHWLEEDVESAEKIPPKGGRDCYWVAEYAANDSFAYSEDRGFSWRPSIHMPRWASRITLEITDVRVQRLQEISEEDAQAEGCFSRTYTHLDVNDILISDASPHIKELAKLLGPGSVPARADFCRLWETIYHTWDENPWVWAVSFKMVRA